MPLISQPGGNRETFLSDDGFRRAFVNSVWLCSQGYSARKMSLRAEGVRGVYGHRLGTWLDPLLHSVNCEDGFSRHRSANSPYIQSG